MTSRENGAPQESKKVMLEVLDINIEKLLGALRGPEVKVNIEIIIM